MKRAKTFMVQLSMLGADRPRSNVCRLPLANLGAMPLH
jgi:hypothetical protein